MDCLADVTSATFSHFNNDISITLADDLVLDVDVPQEYPERTVFTELLNVMPDDTTLAIIADNAIGIEANVMIPDLSCPINETERFNILPSATREADNSYELKNDNAA
nr:unnamed protein product [Callosobruchus chinensis]